MSNDTKWGRWHGGSMSVYQEAERDNLPPEGTLVEIDIPNLGRIVKPLIHGGYDKRCAMVDVEDKRFFLSDRSNGYPGHNWKFRYAEPQEPDLYEKVKALRLSTIFRVGAGDPFVRTRSGVATIMGVASELPSLGGSPIPKHWATHEVQDITIIWEPRL
jgi:hypothetical protein